MAGPQRSSTRRRRGALDRIGGLVTRRPRLVMAVWFGLLGLLAMQGMGIEGKLSTDATLIDGSETKREHEISVQQFGSEAAMVVMLRGPEQSLERQGPKLARRLGALPDALVISPWTSGGTIEGLRPSPRAAGLLVSVGAADGTVEADVVPVVERRVERTVSKPVRASIAGGLPLGDALRSSIEQAAKTGELVAIPVLLLVLLFVCRSFIAAAMPVVVGAIVVGASRGVLDLFAGLVDVDAFALGAAGMLGLALGVDYSLLVVSRYREEIEGEGQGEAEVAGAVRRTVTATGRSVIPAGCGLVLAMLVSSQLLPGSVVSSVALAVIVASVLSVFSALFATPAILMLLGEHLDRWSLPGRRDSQIAVLRWSQRLARRPALALGIAFALFLCASWAFTLETKIGTVGQLPPENSSRRQHEDIQRTLGLGWIAPLEVIVSSDEGPVTTRKRLQALTAFQRRVEDDPGVATMAGFASLGRATKQLASVGPGLAAQQRGLARIGTGLARVHDGSDATTEGLLAAEDGARQLGSAIGAAREGGGFLADALRSTAKGSAELSGGLEEADEGGGKLASGASKSSSGAGRLAKALQRAEERAADSQGSTQVLENALQRGERSLAGLDGSVQAGEDSLAAARLALQQMSAGRNDPQYAAALAAVNEASRALSGADPAAEELPRPPPDGVGAGIQRAQSQFDLGLYLAARLAKDSGDSQEGMEKLASAAARLDRSLGRLAARSEDFSDGIAKLASGGEGLSPGLRKLTASAERLVGGLGEIGGGAEGLSGGLGEGAQRSTLLTGALGRLDSGVERQQDSGGGLSQNSPDLFRSGYFYLAGLDGSGPEQRNQAGFMINLGGGGTAARMLVIPTSDPATGEAREVRDRLRERAGELAEEADAEVVVGGVTPAVLDVDSALREQAPRARIALSLVTILIILFVTRSLALALLAAAFNLVTVSATFGLMALLFDGSLLGGPGYVDSTIIPASIILIFGLAIDYEVFIFARMREEYVRGGSAAAISEGLGRSANVVTGAALIMIAVFLAFAVSPLVTLRNLGVALSIAVFIDAFLIRFVIVPATMTALGERSWWIPRWLDRLLPGGARPAAGGGTG